MIDFNFNIKENSPVYCVNCNKLLVNLYNPYLGPFSVFRCFDCGICLNKNNFISYDNYATNFCITYSKNKILITNQTNGKRHDLENLFDFNSIEEVIKFIKKLSNKPELFIFI